MYKMDPMQQPVTTPVPQNNQIESVEEVLKDRTKTYGSFNSNALCTQEMYKVALCGESNHKLMSIHKEAIHMILHKISRIVNGDPNYDDSWVDISGYATLVVKHIRGEK